MFFAISSTEWMDRFLSLVRLLPRPFSCFGVFTSLSVISRFIFPGSVDWVVSWNSDYCGPRNLSWTFPIYTVCHLVSATVSLVPMDFPLSWAWPPTPQSILARSRCMSAVLLSGGNHLALFLKWRSSLSLALRQSLLFGAPWVDHC